MKTQTDTDTNQTNVKAAAASHCAEDDGQDAASAIAFVATFHELEVISRHWLNTRLEISLAYFLYGQTGSTETSLDSLAEERMERLCEAMGEGHYAKFAEGLSAEFATRYLQQTPGDQDGDAEHTPQMMTFPDDCDGLGYVRDEDGMVVGYVSEVNGAGGAVSNTFVPALVELEIITRHWLFVHLDTSYYCHVTSQSGSTEYRLLLYSDQRLIKLREALGDERYLRACAEVDAQFEERFGQEEWRSFRIPEK
jgi:predicted secreted protein